MTATGDNHPSYRFVMHYDHDEIVNLLMGRRIVNAVIRSEPPPQALDWWDTEERSIGYLTLDDGIELIVLPNRGACVCSSGDFDVTHLATVENVITRVEFAESGSEDWMSEQSYTIFVYTGEEKINAVTVEGNDGSGYYGTGYEIAVSLPGKPARTSTTAHSTGQPRFPRFIGAE